jgi:hypothetical protein
MPDQDHPAWPLSPAPMTEAPLYCVDGSIMCRVRVLTDEEWNALPTTGRPHRAERVQGLGWVVAIPVEHLN